MDCLFCKIASKEIPAEVIYENGGVVAFLDINPMTLGHTVIIPKNHAGNILDLPDDEVEPTFLAVKYVTGMLTRALNPEGFTIGVNHGRMSGQTVPHLHIHVIPRYSGDGGGSIHSVVKYPPKEEIEETKKKIIKASNGN